MDAAGLKVDGAEMAQGFFAPDDASSGNAELQQLKRVAETDDAGCLE